MDMWERYVNSVRAHLADAEEKLVFDRYHIMSHLGKAVDTVRKQENRALAAEGDKSLAGSKHLCTPRRTSPRKHRERFDALRGADLKTTRA